MKNRIIKHWLLSYDSKVFGKTFRHLRVVNTAMPLFLLAGLFNLFTEGFGIWDALVFVPFLLVFFAGKLIDWDIKDLDWEQQYQLETTKPLHEKWIKKYGGAENFVEAWRFFFPIACILAALLIYWIFGVQEYEFDELRGF